MICALEGHISCLCGSGPKTCGDQPEPDLPDPKKILCCLRSLCKQGRSLQVAEFKSNV